MQIQPILGLHQPISTLGPLFLQILDPALLQVIQMFESSWWVGLTYDEDTTQLL